MHAPTLARTSRASIVLKWLGRHHGSVAFLAYLAVAVGFEHQAVAHLSTVCACNGASDPTLYIWAMAWWPYAILHGLNPLVTHYIYIAPGGFNLAAVTATPTAALLAWPLTATAGPVVAYNITTMLAPVVSAWFAYRLCLYVTRAASVSVVGGYLFGFSSYELAQLLGHLHLLYTFAIPALALLTLQHLDGVISARRYIVLSTILLILQLGLSSEMLFTLTCMGAISLICGYAFVGPEYRRRIVRLVPKLGIAYAAMGLLTLPFLYQELRGPTFANAHISADALSFLIPTTITRIGGQLFSSVSANFPGNLAEQGTYLGLPLVAMAAAFVIERRRTAAAKTALAISVVALVWCLGSYLYVDGHRLIPLPWKLFASLPMLHAIIPVRIGVYLSLVAVVMATWWLSSSRTHAAVRWTIAGLAVAFLVPNLGLTYGPGISVFHAPLRQPAFFTTNTYRRYLHRGETVLPVPYGGPSGLSMMWQADANMYFRMVSGTGYVPPDYAEDPIVRQLITNQPTARASSELERFIIRKRISHVIMDRTHAGPWPRVLAQLGLQPTAVGGVLLYTMPSAWQRPLNGRRPPQA